MKFFKEHLLGGYLLFFLHAICKPNKLKLAFGSICTFYCKTAIDFSTSHPLIWISE